jgi:hypothetical protein
MEVKGVHDFFITKIIFSPDEKNVISISADYACKITPIIPQNNGNLFISLFLLFIIY